MKFAVCGNESYDRTGDRSFIDELKDKAYQMLTYLRGFENDDGLLERLHGWIFVEWSRANSLVRDINYPTNMLYYRFKIILSELYGDETLKQEAEAMRRKIREQSLGEMFFCDNAVYNAEGVAVLSGESTESCQYYAFFMGVATPSEDPLLWETLVRDFGPSRKKSNRFEKVHFSNAFIGNYLRCELLMRENRRQELERDIRGYFVYMAEKTGTLWENDTVCASCNHGFASHVLVWLRYLGYLNEN